MNKIVNIQRITIYNLGNIISRRQLLRSYTYDTKYEDFYYESNIGWRHAGLHGVG